MSIFGTSLKAHLEKPFRGDLADGEVRHSSLRIKLGPTTREEKDYTSTPLNSDATSVHFLKPWPSEKG
jgi:hypothetical protein